SIKQAYLSRKLAEQRGNYSNPDILSFSDSDDPHILIKDVFGLSSSENWKYYHQTVSKNHPEIKRFQSPLVFKPVQINVRCFKVGINCRSIHEDYLGSIFDVSLGNQKGLKLKVPETFSWSDFWDFYLGNKSKKMPKLNERLGGIPDEKRQPEYSIIKQIEQTLKRHVS
ncbi:MAG: hypothetical protein MI810_02120, partial [Flavobacteriales bacterium]|nr:hypothetical protein [Flavobacteriales bacterium]